jgi:hypothetical protein
MPHSTPLWMMQLRSLLIRLRLVRLRVQSETRPQLIPEWPSAAVKFKGPSFEELIANIKGQAERGCENLVGDAASKCWRSTYRVKPSDQAVQATIENAAAGFMKLAQWRFQRRCTSPLNGQ